MIGRFLEQFNERVRLHIASIDKKHIKQLIRQTWIDTKGMFLNSDPESQKQLLRFALLLLAFAIVLTSVSNSNSEPIKVSPVPNSVEIPSGMQLIGLHIANQEVLNNRKESHAWADLYLTEGVDPMHPKVLARSVPLVRTNDTENTWAVLLNEDAGPLISAINQPVAVVLRSRPIKSKPTHRSQKTKAHQFSLTTEIIEEVKE